MPPFSDESAFVACFVCVTQGYSQRRSPITRSGVECYCDGDRSCFAGTQDESLASELDRIELNASVRVYNIMDHRRGPTEFAFLMRKVR